MFKYTADVIRGESALLRRGYQLRLIQRLVEQNEDLREIAAKFTFEEYTAHLKTMGIKPNMKAEEYNILRGETVKPVESNTDKT